MRIANSRGSGSCVALPTIRRSDNSTIPAQNTQGIPVHIPWFCPCCTKLPWKLGASSGGGSSSSRVVASSTSLTAKGRSSWQSWRLSWRRYDHRRSFAHSLSHSFVGAQGSGKSGWSFSRMRFSLSASMPRPGASGTGTKPFQHRLRGQSTSRRRRAARRQLRVARRGRTKNRGSAPTGGGVRRHKPRRAAPTA